MSYFDATKTPEYSKFIYKSRYARWLDNEGRRETWDETVKRYIDFFADRLPEHELEIRKLEKSILNFDTMPSMRALMAAGPALSRDEVANYNCLAGDTLVTTREYGIVPISQMKGKSVHIVDGNGEWTLSKCKSYGEQDLYSVEIGTSGKGNFSIKATGNHHWIKKNEERCYTEELRPGMRLASVSMPTRKDIDISKKDYKLGIIHGIIYGDGTAQYKQSSGQSKKVLDFERICSGFVIRLCSDSEDLLPYFKGYPKTCPPSFNGDPVIYIHGCPLDLKSLPDLSLKFFSEEYLTGFIRGWLAADGSVSHQSQVSLACNEEGLEWINKVGPSLGFVARGQDEYPTETNLGKRTEPLFRIRFDRRWLTSDDFIIKRKRNNFKKIDIKKNPGHAKVKSVNYYGREEVFCFEVPTTKSFLLTKNLLTGNCAYLVVDHPRAFDECMYILMCGTGVGFSVERQYVSKLPEVAEELHPTDTTIQVRDSRIGWAASYKELISLLYNGQIPKWDLSNLRPAGARLKTFGGRSSGPEPLNELFHFTVKLFQKASGRKLSSIECHDLVCKIAEIVVVGGVRRSALLSLSNLSDDRMRRAKAGQWYVDEKQRQLANNSACYTEKPELSVFLNEWMSLYDSKSGERGIFSRVAAKKQVEKNGRRDSSFDFGCNPCSEILLRPNQFCNLTEVVIRPDDTIKSLLKKVRAATILGTLQSTMTKFRYLRKAWARNTEEERLLGVSLTGIMDHPIFGDPNNPELPALLNQLRDEAIKTNKIWAKKLGIPQSVAITCVKPSGTVSQVVNASSGIHPRFSKFYIRRVRIDKKDSICEFLLNAGVSGAEDVMNPSTMVFDYPIESPASAVVVSDVGALEQLKLWMIYQEHWCEHKPSCTVYYTDDEFLEVGAWIWKNFDKVSGISFLPKTDHIYQQAPYEEITEQKYLELKSALPNIDWDDLSNFETEDNTVGSHTLACTGGVCESVDLV